MEALAPWFTALEPFWQHSALLIKSVYLCIFLSGSPADVHSPEQREGHLPFQCHIRPLHLQPLPPYPETRHQDPRALISLSTQTLLLLSALAL